MGDEREILIGAYCDFNARNIDAVLERMHPDVEWANGMEGGHVHGREEVRAYWTRQFGIINPQVEPRRIDVGEDGRFVVEVHQVVRDMESNLLLDTTVYHLYRMRDGLIERMDIVKQDSSHGETD
jgi:ketosteroid isomerase-like protein